ncbi:MAG: AbrB/MazE/SpoVT family DNA-binding domain-containing protein [Candidatus Thermoplasmatota archaeon]|nr:AbrB/MazE/SpoVT family DNA-binding domain-containing protein [Candidatus Thermoplasmatota archaeon]
MTEVIKVTSKGQITLPVDIRKTLRIDKDGYLMVEAIGDFILLKKANVRIEELNELMSKAAKNKKVSRKEIEKAILKARKETWAE